jgi:hypothetical protein
MNDEVTLAAASNDELLAVLSERLTAALAADGSGSVAAAGLFGPRPDGSRPILDAIASLFNSPAFQALLMQLLTKLLGGVAPAK